MSRREELEQVLKEEIREMERDRNRTDRSAVDLKYLKNCVL